MSAKGDLKGPCTNAAALEAALMTVVDAARAPASKVLTAPEAHTTAVRGIPS